MHCTTSANPALVRFARAGRRLALLSLAAGLAPQLARGGQVSLYDGDFASGWTHSKLVDTTPGAASTYSVLTQPSGGSLGAYHETTHVVNGAGTLVVGHVSSLTWDPSSAPVTSIAVRYDLRYLHPSSGSSIRFRLLLQQNGTTYQHPTGHTITPSQWVSFFQTDMTAASFVRVAGPGPAVPDLSCSGAPIAFGYSSEVGIGGGSATRIGGLDGFVVTLHIGTDQYLDGEFVTVQWARTKLLDTSPGQVNSFSAAMPISGGNPDYYQEITHVVSSGMVGVSVINTVFVHPLPDLPVYSIDFAFDAAHFTSPPGAPDAIGCRLLFRQGDSYYAGPPIQVVSASWSHFEQKGLLATDLDLVAGSGPPHPDLTSTGTSFTYGFLTSSATPGTRVCGVDNLLIRRYTQPVCGSGPGTVYCEGNSPSAPCPCFPAIPAGAAGHGCPNSFFPAGARLLADGVASLSADTLVLQGTAMPNHASCIYLQGTAPGAAAFGDGLRCATGTVIRLGSRLNPSNSSQFPGPSDGPVSVRGQVVAPGVRYYQVWYRNGAAGYCTSAPWNLTNGLSIAWGA